MWNSVKTQKSHKSRKKNSSKQDTGILCRSWPRNRQAKMCKNPCGFPLSRDGFAQLSLIHAWALRIFALIFFYYYYYYHCLLLYNATFATPYLSHTEKKKKIFAYIYRKYFSQIFTFGDGEQVQRDTCDAYKSLTFA